MGRTVSLRWSKTEYCACACVFSASAGGCKHTHTHSLSLWALVIGSRAQLEACLARAHQEKLSQKAISHPWWHAYFRLPFLHSTSPYSSSSTPPLPCFLPSHFRLHYQHEIWHAICLFYNYSSTLDSFGKPGHRHLRWRVLWNMDSTAHEGRDLLRLPQVCTYWCVRSRTHECKTFLKKDPHFAPRCYCI